MMFICGLLLSLVLSYLIAHTWCGSRRKDDLDSGAMRLKNTFRLVITPYDKRVLKLTIMLSPFVFILEVILYWLWLRDIILKR